MTVGSSLGGGEGQVAGELFFAPGTLEPGADKGAQLLPKPLQPGEGGDQVGVGLLQHCGESLPPSEHGCLTIIHGRSQPFRRLPANARNGLGRDAKGARP